MIERLTFERLAKSSSYFAQEAAPGKRAQRNIWGCRGVVLLAERLNPEDDPLDELSGGSLADRDHSLCADGRDRVVHHTPDQMLPELADEGSSEV